MFEIRGSERKVLLCVSLQDVFYYFRGAVLANTMPKVQKVSNAHPQLAG